jgi:hypothetical protein
MRGYSTGFERSSFFALRLLVFIARDVPNGVLAHGVAHVIAASSRTSPRGSLSSRSLMTASGGIRTAARALCAGLVLVACSTGQGRTKPVGPPPALPEQRRAARFAPLPEWYWEPVEADVHASPRAVELPVAEGSLVRVEGATRLWDELGAEVRERLRRDGLVVLGTVDPAGTAPPATRLRMGAFYMDQRQQRVPYVVTLDALAYAMHLGFERALAEVDDEVLAPELDAFLAKLDARLTVEQRGAGIEVGEALLLARAVVAVARGLAGDQPAAGSPTSELAPAVAQEIARVVAHTGRGPSALLGVPLDYGRFVVPRGAARPGSFRALSWLASAPLVLLARSEVRGGILGVATARLHTRAAMVLTRVTDRDVDAGVYASWSRLSRVLAFVWGPSDDLSLRELDAAASALGWNLEDPKHAANVVTVDHLRHRAAGVRTPQLYDGTGAPGPAGVSVRIFGGHAPADALALASFARAHESAIPSSLDLAVWLEAPEARASLHESDGDASAAYDGVLAHAVTLRPEDGAASRHASVYGSQLDAVMTWLTPQDETARPLSSVAARRAAIESALASWTYARHGGQPLSRPRPSRASHATRELQVSGTALPAFVEAAPDVIARLVATAGQMKRGLAGLGALGPSSPGMVALAEVEDILRIALRVATRTANDETLPAEDLTALASLPARLANLEEPGEGGVAVGGPVVAEVFVDASGHRVLSTATGAIEPAAMIVREPGTGRLVMAVGAHVAHHELVEARGQQTRQIAELVAREGAPLASLVRAPYTSAFRTVR